jgi:hypothetical protein
MTTKYHHITEKGSMLGISWINPDEVDYIDSAILKIIDYTNLKLEMKNASKKIKRYSEQLCPCS